MPQLCFPLIFPAGKKPAAQKATALPEQQQHSNLQLGAGVQHDVLQSVLDVFCPRGQPGNCVVKTHLLPLVPFWWLWDLGVPVGRVGLQPSDEGEETGCQLDWFFSEPRTANTLQHYLQNTYNPPKTAPQHDQTFILWMLGTTGELSGLVGSVLNQGHKVFI